MSGFGWISPDGIAGAGETAVPRAVGTGEGPVTAGSWSRETPEEDLQAWWADLPRGRVLRSGRGSSSTVRLLFPGRWNREAGPDFRGARWRVGRRLWEGDVEIHREAEEWYHHSHHQDPAYNRVRLHVVLWSGSRPTRRADGRSVRKLAVLPQAMPREAGAGPDFPTVAELRWRAAQRWSEAVSRAESERAGLEGRVWAAMGDVRNGTALAALARRFPRGRSPAEDWSVAELWEAGRGWRTQGVRPAGHPRRCLEALLRWRRARPGWPEEVVAALAEERVRGEPIGAAERLRQQLLGSGELGGLARQRTVLVDAVLPWAAVSGEASFWGEVWFRAPVGAMPGAVRGVVRGSGIAGWSNGWAQGVLGFWEATQSGPGLGR